MFFFSFFSNFHMSITSIQFLCYELLLQNSFILHWQLQTISPRYGPCSSTLKALKLRLASFLIVTSQAKVDLVKFTRCVCVCVLGSSQVDMIVLESYIHLLTIGFFQMLRFKIHLAIKYEFFDVIKRYLEKVNPVKIS